MANVYQNASGVWLVRFRFGSRQYYRSLGTADEKQANGVKAQVEETLWLLKRGRLSLPAGAGPDEAAIFILSGGKATQRPVVAPATACKRAASRCSFLRSRASASLRSRAAKISASWPANLSAGAMYPMALCRRT
jgi:hypothetical protein